MIMYLFSVIILQGIFQLLIYMTSCKKGFVFMGLTKCENILALLEYIK